MRCPSCDTPNPPEATRCEECGRALTARPVRRRPESDAIEERPTRRRPDDEAREAPRTRRRRPDDEDDEEYEDDRPRRRRRRPQDEDEAIATLIPYKNPTALASYYCGVFSLIPILAFVLAPISIVLGIMGLRHVRRNPRAHGTGHAITGLVLSVLTLSLNTLVLILILTGAWAAWFRS
jgi:hypothetical protein